MKIIVADNKNLETHNLLIKFIRIFSVPLLNGLPPSMIQSLMKKSNHDAKTAVENPATTLALEGIYTRHQRSLFYKGILNGLADLFWHHCLSQPKALRNRLKIVEENLETEIFKKINENRENITILSVGGGSTRGIIHSLDKLHRDNINHKIKVINIDKSEKAIELGKEISKKYLVHENFEWICDDARNIKSLIKSDSVDIVEMVGLLDYFADEKGIEVIKQIYNVLKSEGLFIVANVHPNSETTFVSKTGWPKMYYRKPEELAKILSSAGFSKEETIIFEPLKVHIIGLARK